MALTQFFKREMSGSLRVPARVLLIKLSSIVYHSLLLFLAGKEKSYARQKRIVGIFVSEFSKEKTVVCMCVSIVEDRARNLMDGSVNTRNSNELERREK